jgi:hypothetical protein
MARKRARWRTAPAMLRSHQYLMDWQRVVNKEQSERYRAGLLLPAGKAAASTCNHAPRGGAAADSQERRQCR